MTKILQKIKDYRNVLVIVSLLIIALIIIFSDFRTNDVEEKMVSEKVIDPFILITKGSAIVKRDKILKLSQKEKFKIMIGDKIRTFEDSNATLFWPDGSITRLGAKTALIINVLKVDTKLSASKVEFNLEEGKTWSNIVKFLSKGSSFTETYEYGNYAATVRGTVFEMNLDNNYLHAVSHDVEITDKGKSKDYMVPEGGARNLHDPKNKVPSEAWDNDFIDSNLIADKEFLRVMLEDFRSSLKSMMSTDIGTGAIEEFKQRLGMKKELLVRDIGASIAAGKDINSMSIQNLLPTMSVKDKYLLNQKLSKLYQKVHSLPNEDNIAEYKSDLRDMILSTGDAETNKELLPQFTKLDLFDYLDVKNRGNTEVSEKLKKGISNYIDKISDPKEIQVLLQSFGGEMLNVIGIDFSKVKESTDILMERLNNPDVQEKLKSNIGQKANDLNKSIDNALFDK